MFPAGNPLDTAYNPTPEKMMEAERLAVIRRTKLDIAQWIATGIGGCRNPATSLCLARYAAAQLESAAHIPVSASQDLSRIPSLLRRELKNSRDRRPGDGVRILARVSRAMISVLGGNATAHTAVANLIRHEAAASKQIRALSRG